MFLKNILVAFVAAQAGSSTQDRWRFACEQHTAHNSRVVAGQRRSLSRSRAVVGAMMTNNVGECFRAFEASERFREYPLQIRVAFQKVAAWLPEHVAPLSMAEVNAAFTNRLRHKAYRERGQKFSNQLLVLLQTLVKIEIANGSLLSNRIRQVPKLRLAPPLLGTDRRYIPPIRQPISSHTNPVRKKSSKK